MFTEFEFTIIVGAGPTGLTLARELQRRGTPFRLLEKETTPFQGSRGKGIQPRTQEILDDLGLIERFRAAGGDYPPLLVHLPDGGTVTRRMDEHFDPSPSVPYPNVLMVPQWRTAQLLADGLPIEYGVGVEALTQDERGVYLTLSTGEQVTARYVVGADGGRSTIRKAVGVEFEGSTREAERMFLADVRLTGLDRDNWHLWADADGRSIRLSLCPLAGTDDFQLVTPHLDTPLDELVASVDPGITITHTGWTSQYRANIRMAARFRVGNVFLAGDAAHVHSPAGGQGLNTGIQDAYNLAWKLATANDALLDTYEAERLPVAATVLGISTKLHQRAVDRTDDAMRRDDPILRQLSLTYRDSPLTADHRPSPGAVQAGDRAPDAPLTTNQTPHAPLPADRTSGTPRPVGSATEAPLPADRTPDAPLPPGQTPDTPPPVSWATETPLPANRTPEAEASLPAGRVFDLLRGPHATLLAIDWPDDLPVLPGIPAYRADEAREIYDVHEPTLFLVRPDNYIGCVTSSVEDVIAYAKLIGQ